MTLRLGRYDYACYFAYIAYACSSFIISLLLVDIGHDLNFPLEQGGMGTGATLNTSRDITMLIFLLTCDFIACRLGKRITIGCAMLVTGVSILACALTSRFWILTALLLFAGVGEGVCEGLATPFINDLHRKEPETYVSIAHGFWSVGTVFVVVMVCFLNGLGLHWRWMVGAVGSLGILSSLGFLWKEKTGYEYPETIAERNRDSTWHKHKDIFLSPRFWLYSLGMLVGGGAEFSLTFWSASYIRLTFQQGVWAGALGTAAIGLGMFVGRCVIGCRVPQKKIGLYLMSCAFSCIPLTLFLLCLNAESFGGRLSILLTVLYLVLFLCGICIASFWPTLQVYGVLRLPNLDSTLLYIYFSSVGIPGCALFTMLIGWLGDQGGLQTAFILMPVSMFLYGTLIFIDLLLCRRECRKTGVAA